MTRRIRIETFYGHMFILWILAFCHLPAVAQEGHSLHAGYLVAAPGQPLRVEIGVKIDQIINIDQKSENFGVVGTLLMKWNQPEVYEAIGGSNFEVKTFTPAAFVELVDKHGIQSPGFLIQNQQGRRFSQDARVEVLQDGSVYYFEIFTVTLQAPELDFTQYPFDRQVFFLRLLSVMPENFAKLVPMPGFSKLGGQLGEEEWRFERSWIESSSVEGVTGLSTSQLSFGIEGSRHLNYYYIRIFIPLVIIILVSWFTFFLFDYNKRVDMAVTTLLVFVAFNFTISDDLPKLGYLTFMDTIVFSTFVFSGLVVLVNVVFKRMEVNGQESLARTIDKFTLWIYPAALVLFILICWHQFMVAPVAID